MCQVLYVKNSKYSSGVYIYILYVLIKNVKLHTTKLFLILVSFEHLIIETAGGNKGTVIEGFNRKFCAQKGSTSSC